MSSPDTSPRAVCRAARSPEELFLLVDFCRAGKLKEVSEWIAAGKPLDPPKNVKRSRRRQSPLDVAIEKGFFTLTELLLDGGCDPLASGNALCDAVHRDEPEIAKLLLDRGLSPDSIDVSSVFDAGRAMVELFIAHGVDPSANLGYYDALCSKVHPLLFVLKEYKDRFPDLQRQADMALCYHCETGSPRNVGLLLWAGARPDAEVPDPNYSDCTTSALRMAVRSGRLEMIKQLKPQNYPGALQTLTSEIWTNPSGPIIDYLVSLGAPLNTKQNGGCEVIEHLLWRMGLGSRGVFGHSSSTEISASLARIEQLCRLGAKWVPDTDEPLRSTRDRFRKMDPRHLLELFRIFQETGGASVDLLDSILDSPALRKSLGVHLSSVEKVLHPPPPRATNVAAEPTGEDTKVKPAPPTAAELRARAQILLLDIVRQEPALHFTEGSTSSVLDGNPLKKRLGMLKDDDRDVQPIVNEASKKLNARLRSFQTQVEWWGRVHCRLTATLNKEDEWPEALQEAWNFAENPNDALLTDVALKLRELILSAKLGSGWIPERSITFKIGLYGRERVLSPYLNELENKTDLQFAWEQEGTRWGDPSRYRIVIAKRSAPRANPPSAVNPNIDVRFDYCRKQDRDIVQHLLYGELLKTPPQGTTPFFLLSISTRKQLRACFPRFTSNEEVAQFFLDLPIHKSLTRQFDFRENASWWFVSIHPEQDWSASLAAIREELSQPGLAERYGISPEAAKLLDWIENLPSAHLTGPWTPVVEEARDRWIGISCPWSEENFPAYLQMLLDEINHCTDYDLLLQPWHQQGREKTRIRIARKRSDLDEVVKQVQLLALQRGSLLNASLARDTIENLVIPQNSNAPPIDDR